MLVLEQYGQKLKEGVETFRDEFGRLEFVKTVKGRAKVPFICDESNTNVNVGDHVRAVSVWSNGQNTFEWESEYLTIDRE